MSYDSATQDCPDIRHVVARAAADRASDPQSRRRAFKAGCAPLLGIVVVLSACGAGSDAQPAADVAAQVQMEVAVPAPDQVDKVVVYKSPTCGCCTKWADYLTANGFDVETRDTDDLAAVKQRLGVPSDLRSCHTATIGKHVVEGHVPAEDIRRFITSVPGGVLAVPGMPAGSPGMEHPTVSVAYDAFLVRPDGEVRPFAHHPAAPTE